MELFTIIIILLVFTIFYWPDVIFRYFISHDLTNKIVLITGGGGGLGRRMAVLFATKKCKVIIWDIRQNLIDETLKEIKDAGFSGTGYVCDVSKKRNGL